MAYRILGPHFLTTAAGSGWSATLRQEGMLHLDKPCHTTGRRDRRGLHKSETAAQECADRLLASKRGA